MIILTAFCLKHCICMQIAKPYSMPQFMKLCEHAYSTWPESLFHEHFGEIDQNKVRKLFQKSALRAT